MKVIVFAYNVLGFIGLKKMLEHDFEVLALVTHKDDPNEKIYFDSVEQYALSKGIKVFTPDSPNKDEFVDIIRSLKPDAIFSFYYRNMISQKILDVVDGKAYNLHGSLLPKYRGRCPVNWVLLFGENETGVTLHKMVKQADRGDIVDQEKIDILPEDNAKTLQPKMEQAAIVLLDRVLPLMREGKETLAVQDEALASYFGGRKPEDGLIDWSKSAFEIHNLVRAVTDPFPGAYSNTSYGKFIIWSSRIDNDTEYSRKPGTILSLSPLKISAGKGIIEVVKAQLGDNDIMSGTESAYQFGLELGCNIDSLYTNNDRVFGV